MLCVAELGIPKANALTARTEPYPDVPRDSHFAGYIAYCQKEGLMGSCLDGNFHPSSGVTATDVNWVGLPASDATDAGQETASLTRLQFCQYLAEAKNLQLSSHSSQSPFADLSWEDEGYEAVLACWEAGIVNGDSNGNFNPDATLTRGAAAKVLCVAELGINNANALNADTAPYPDVPADNIFAGYIAYCQKEGLMDACPGGNFCSGAGVTAADVNWPALTVSPSSIGGLFSSDFETEADLFWLDWATEEYGEGLYWFRVRGFSADITKQTHSPWSALCGPYDLGDLSQVVSGTLTDLLEVLAGETVASAGVMAEIVNSQLEEKGLSLKDLAAAMSADDGKEGGTLETISKLEEAAKVTTTTAVDADANIAATIDADSVSVVGAGLNAGEASEVTLQIGDADRAGIDPDEYADAVQFSMHLVDENNKAVDADETTAGNQLVMPVSITLPVPAGINPAFLVVLHYIESEGRYERVHPYVFEKDGQWFASFTVTSFSDFAFAAVKLQAETQADGVLVYASFANGLTGDVYCAAYADSGKQLGAIQLEPAEKTAGDHELFLPCNGTSVDQVKLFLLDDSGAPQFVAAETTVG